VINSASWISAITPDSTFASTSGNIDGAATKTLSAQWQAVRVVSDGSNWFVV
jgi:hypothetical protein